MIRSKVIATRLKSYRLKKNVSPAKMVANTSLTEDQYLLYEDGSQPIPLTNLEASCFLGCSMKEFLAEEEAELVPNIEQKKRNKPWKISLARFKSF